MNEDWIRIYEFYDCDSSKLGEKIWLNDVLEDNNIPYSNEVVSYWTGIKIPQYHEKLCVYIQEEYKKQVLEYINEYDDPDNIVNDVSTNHETFAAKDFKERDEINESLEKRKKRLSWIYIIYLSLFFAAIIFALIFSHG